MKIAPALEMETPPDTDSAIARAPTEVSHGPLRRLRAAVMSRLFDDEPPPERIGRYEIDRVIGSGGMGAVFVARDPQLDREVAVKLLHWSQGGSEGKRLLREAKGLARLSHANVVQVHDAGIEDGRVFLAMELVRGSDLHAWLRAEPRGWREVVDVFLAAGRGLAAAHAAGLVHRDFKPANVLVSDTGEVKVADFGLVRATDGATDGLGELPEPSEAGASEAGASESGAVDDGPLESLTRTGSSVGTPAYMSPEQHAALPTDARTDQFSFCVALYEGLYGTLPFPSATIQELVVAARRDRVELPRRPAVPAALQRVLRRGLRTAPGDRFADMPALLAALEAARRPARRGWALGLAAVGLLALGSVGIAWDRGSTTPSQTPTAAAGAGQVDACDSDAQTAAIWDDEARDRVADHLRTVDAEIGPKAAEIALTSMDGYLEDWRTNHRATCEADAEADASRHLAQRLCLESRLQEARGVISVLEHADASIAANASQIVAALEPVSECMGPRPVVRTPGTADDALSFDLARARSLWHTRQPKQAHAAAVALAERAAAADERGLEADAWLLAGMIATFDTLGEGDVALAKEAYDEALDAARAVRDPTRLLRVEVMQVIAVAEHGGPKPLPALQGLATRVETSQDPISTWAYHYWMSIPFINLDEGSVREHAEQMLRIADERFGPGHRLVELSQRIAQMAGVTPRPDAQQRREQVGRVATMFGDGSPRAIEEQEQLARSLEREGELDAARELLQAIAQAWGALRGVRSTEVGGTWRNLAQLERRRGDYEASLAAYDRAIEALQDNPVVDHKGEHNVLSAVLFGRAEVLLQLHRAADALEAAELSVAVRHDRQSVGLFESYLGVLRGKANLELGKPAAALTEFQTVRETWVPDASPMPLWQRIIDAIDLGEGRALAALGRHRAAQTQLREVWARLDGRTERKEADALLHARAGLALIQILQAGKAETAELEAIATAALASLPAEGGRPEQVELRRDLREIVGAAAGD